MNPAESAMEEEQTTLTGYWQSSTSSRFL